MSEPGRASSSRRLISSHCGLAPAARALEREAAAQLLAVQDEDGVAALERLRPGDAAALLVGAAVPDDHAAVAERALEVVVAERRGPRPGPPGAWRRDRATGPSAPPRSASPRRPRGAGRSGGRSPGAPGRRRRPALTPRIANCSWPSTCAGSTAAPVAEERHQRLAPPPRALGVELARRPDPAEHAQLARPGGHLFGGRTTVDDPAQSDPRRHARGSGRGGRSRRGSGRRRRRRRRGGRGRRGRRRARGLRCRSPTARRRSGCRRGAWGRASRPASGWRPGSPRLAAVSAWPSDR